MRLSVNLLLFISSSPVQFPKHRVYVTLLSPKSAILFCRTQVTIKMASASQALSKASRAVLGLYIPSRTFQQSHKVGRIIISIL